MNPEFTAVCVEDDEDARILFRHVVMGLGGALTETTNTADGLAAIREIQPGLVLLDLALPGQSGWKVVDAMRADPELQDTPIIVVTIIDQAEEAYHGQRVDWVQSYITKPFSMADLEASIKKVL